MSTLKPPSSRTHLGQQFSEVNANKGLILQYCNNCGALQYPPREVCRSCLSEDLEWRESEGRGTLVNTVQLANSLEPFYQQHLPWGLASVELAPGVIAYAHAAHEDLKPGMAVQVFCHPDASGEAVLVVVREDVDITLPEQRSTVMSALGLL